MQKIARGKNTLSNQVTSVTHLLGKLSHAAHAIPPGPLFYRNLQGCLQKALEEGSQNYDHPCLLSSEALEELDWWIDHLTDWNGRRLLTPKPDLVIETDASTVGWGSSCQNSQTGGPWSCQEREMHINCLEPLAAFLAVKAFLKSSRNLVVHLKMDREHHSIDVYQQVRRHCVSRPQSPHQRGVDMVHGKTDNSPGHSLSRITEHSYRRGVSRDERSIGLDVASRCIPGDLCSNGSHECRPVCLSADTSPADVCEPASRSKCDRRGCLLGLDKVSRLCQPTLEPDKQSSSTGLPSEISDSACCTGMAESTVVSSPPGPAGRGAPVASQHSRSDSADAQRKRTGDSPSSSRVEYLRRKYTSQNVSEEASELLLASWRQKSTKTYDSLFKKWMGWCRERNNDPFSSDIATIVNFLASLYKAGYQYRSINIDNNYRSAIPAVQEKN